MYAHSWWPARRRPDYVGTGWPARGAYLRLAISDNFEFMGDKKNMENVTYEAAINRLIPIAEEETIKKLLKLQPEWKKDLYYKNFRASLDITHSVIGVDEKPAIYSCFTEIFHQTMNRLAREEGLRNI